MADDIDIEEHDVLESLRRRLQPDQTIVKSEPLDIEYAEPQYEDHANENPNNHWGWDLQKVKFEPQDEDEFQFGKIILGTKPALETDNEKPADSIEESTREVDVENYNYNVSLVLKDWGPILEKSNCYCKECQTLFATVNALDAHKMIVHSFLVATDSTERNKAIKSTAKPANDTPDAVRTCDICNYSFKGSTTSSLYRHYRKAHNLDPVALGTRNFKDWKKCNHCNNYFPSDTALVTHLYELLPISKTTPTKEDKKVVIDNVKAKPPMVPKTYEKKVVKPVPTPLIVPASSNLDAKSNKSKNNPIVNAKSTTKAVEAAKSIKQANSLILGSKISVNQVNVKKESVGPRLLRRKCEECGIEYSRKYYLQHMKKFHPDVLVKMGKVRRGVPVGNNTVSPYSHNCKYKCTVCNIILNGLTAVKNHRKNKHPQLQRRKILIRVTKPVKIKKQKVKTIKAKPVKTEQQETDIVVAKSTLFKCNLCSVHFLTCYGACAHSRVCETSSNIRDWSCPQCQRVFKNVDKKAHEFQHKTITSKFKVYVVYLEMVVRILCECPYCYVCFEEYKFWRHVNFGCDRDAESFHCSECRVAVDATSRASHESKHTQGDFTKEDFIKIEFVSSKNALTKSVKVEPVSKDEVPVPNLKRKLASPTVEKKGKEANGRFTLFYCTTCKTYVNVKIGYHVDGKCVEINNGKAVPKLMRQNCQFCGITFTAKSLEKHKQLHIRNPKLTIFDFVFKRITDDKKIKPQAELYKCNSCHIYFTTKTARHRHPCDEVKGTTCKVCHKNINRVSFKSHMRIHNYVIPGKAKPTPKIEVKVENDAVSTVSYNSSASTKSSMKQNRKRKLVQSPMTQLPQLLKKYESLTTLWNILYVCGTCDTFTDSYDKVVEHCQNHFTNMESYGVVIMKCQICNMKFDRECYRRHLELHAGSRVISKKSFQILKYDYSKLFSTDWLSFMDLPDDQKSQILTRSIYGESRFVRMKLFQQGPPEFTVYRCDQCLACVPPESFMAHIKKDCLKGGKFECSMCNLLFANKADCDLHEKVHEISDLETESFRIVAFNDPNDRELNDVIMPKVNLKVYSEPIEECPEFLLKHQDNIKTVKGKRFYMFYKCKNCNVCVLSRTNVKYHVCTDIRKKNCSLCGLLFTYTYMSNHLRLHQKFNLSSENVFTRSFDNSNRTNSDDNASTSGSTRTSDVEMKDVKKGKREEAKLFKCHCGLHYTSLKAIEKHYLGQNCGAIVREKCSQCNLVFDPIEVVNHLCKHHAQGQVRDFKIITPNKKTVYKCNICHVLFFDKNIALKHRDQCQGKFNAVKCNKCGLAFDASGVDRHKSDHKANAQLRPEECYLVTNLPERTKKEKTLEKELFKCEKCDVHFMWGKSATKHAVLYNHCAAKVAVCNECGLKFTLITLRKHKAVHHAAGVAVRFLIRYVNAAGQLRSNKTSIYDPSNSKSKALSSSTSKKASRVQEKIQELGEKFEEFKCKKCGLLFTEQNDLVTHNEDRCSKELSETCDVCDLRFAVKNMNEHKNRHRRTGEWVSDVENESADDSQDLVYRPNTLYGCLSCGLHFNTNKTMKLHSSNKCEMQSIPVKCEICDIKFTKHSLKRHMWYHSKFKFNKDDLEIVYPENAKAGNAASNATVTSKPASVVATDEVDSQASCSETVASLDSSADADTSPNKVEISKLKLYKCGDCNVYFLTQRACYKHVVKHTTLQTKEYIECKLCNFQFTIMSLQTHIKKHHAGEFRLDEVLIEEYRPNDLKHNVPKIEIYYASEKEQSGLVSTTSDVRNDVDDSVDTTIVDNDAIEKEDDIDSNEITSNCNEGVDSSDQNDTPIVNNGDVIDEEKEVPVGVTSSDGN